MAIHHADLLGVSDDVLRNIPLEHWEDDLSAIYNEGRRVRLFHSVNGHDELIVVVLHQKGGDKGQESVFKSNSTESSVPAETMCIRKHTDPYRSSLEGGL